MVLSKESQQPLGIASVPITQPPETESQRRPYLRTQPRLSKQALSPTFATGGVREQKRLFFQRRRAKGLHYRACAGARWTAAILGGGCGGGSRLSWRTSSL